MVFFPLEFLPDVFPEAVFLLPVAFRGAGRLRVVFFTGSFTARMGDFFVISNKVYRKFQQMYRQNRLSLFQQIAKNPALFRSA
ncbi:hypothetical protein BACPLE_02135 [Phocaeicola plebeius DSM 17135]|uniref:Uncharacterized protein n=1 Tax=Phocaeicola plebeius (strain DSM 17135 / JCM 12973 / CCUG 54634 / M2) TaxID=484018 RepID=B5CZH0_PHOPM|nr:hypothetical protein BACPLE_02135 [Phocaeicola plebeius DSM 17135]